MKPDLTRMSIEDLRRLLHAENFKFSQGLDTGLSFNELRQIRLNIRSIRAEIEGRNLMSEFNPTIN